MKYRAFFSYARADDQVANWLHRQLDRYRTPKALIGSTGDFGEVPPKLHPIYRDRNDLEAGGHLGEALHKALEASETLVVLCTPAAAKSIWVNQECQAFLELGRESRIFPVIAAGEPDSADSNTECFPPALRGRGLLAADIRQIKLKTGQLIGDGREGGRFKLIAGLLGVPLDRLIQRERARQRRTIAGLTGVAIAFACIAIVAVWLGLVANANAVRAQAQSDRSLALALSSQSREISGKNDQRALLLAVEAVNATAHEGYVIPDARAALQQGLMRVTGVGLSGHRDEVTLAAFSMDEKLLATASFDHQVRVWDISHPLAPICKKIINLPDVPKNLIFDSKGANLLTLSGGGDSLTSALVWNVQDTRRYPAFRNLMPFGPDDAIAESPRAGMLAVAHTSGEIDLISISNLSRTVVLRTLVAPRAGDIRALNFSADGNILLAGTQTSHVWIWDLTSLRPSPIADVDANLQARQPDMERVPIDILGISDDHTILYAASSTWFENSGWADLDLKLWRLHGLMPTAGPYILSHRGAPNSSAIEFAKFSKDGSSLITMSLDGWIRIWRLKEVFSGGVPVPFNVFRSDQFAESADLSPDGTLFAFTAANEVQMLSVAPLLERQQARSANSLPGFDGSVQFVHFSPSGRFLVAGSVDQTARLWDLQRIDPTSPVISTRPSPYQDTIATFLDNTGEFAVTLVPTDIQFWNLNDPFEPSLQRTVSVDPSWVARVDDYSDCLSCVVLLSPDDRWAAIQGKETNTADIIELSPRGRAFEVPSRVWSVTKEIQFSPDGHWLFVEDASAESLQTVYDMWSESPSIPAREVVNLPRGSYQREISPDSRYILYMRDVNPYYDRVGRDQTVGILAPLGAINDLSKRRNINGFAMDIASAAFSADSRSLAMTGESNFSDRQADDTVVRVLRVDEPNAPVLTLRGQEFLPTAVFTDDGSSLLTASTDMLLQGNRTLTRLWRLNAPSGPPTAQVLPGIVTFLHEAEFSPDGRFLLTISGAGPTARLWAITEKGAALAATLDIPRPQLNWHWDIRFSPNSSILVVSNPGDNSTPFLWHLRQQPNAADQLRNMVSSLLWTVNRQPIESRGIPIENGDEAIQSVSFTSDSKRLIIFDAGETAGGVSGDSSSHVTIVDLNVFPNDYSTYQVLNSPIAASSVTYRPDLNMLFSSGSSISGGSVSTGDMNRRAEAALGRNLTLDEWDRAGLTEPYRPTFPSLGIASQTLTELPAVIDETRQNNPGDAGAMADELIAWTCALNEADISNSVAWSMALQSDGKNALAAATCALSAFPDNANYRDTRGVALALLGRHNEAIADFEFFIQSTQSNPQLSDEVAERKQWIVELREGQNPFRHGIID